MKKTIWWVIIILLIICAIVFSQHKTETTSETPFKIGAALGLTGDAAPWGEASLNAAKLAVDEINQAGGIKGRQLELVTEDMKSTSKDSVSAVSKLINVDKVDAVMITWLDSYQGSESVVPKNTLLISQDAAIESVNVPTNHENVFSLWYRTKAKAEVTLNEMVKSGYKTLYLITQNDSYYATLLTFLKNEAAAKGITVIGAEAVNPGSDSRTLVAKINQAKPDVVFFGSYDEKMSVDFIKRYRDIVGTKIPLFGDEFIEQDVADVNFVISTLEGVKFYVPSNPDPEFKKKYVVVYGKDPAFSAGTTYDTIKVIAKMLGDKPTDIGVYMKNTQFDTTTYGKVKFDDIGGVVADKSAIVMKKVENGKIVEIK
jgi:branched-chain amino acid transport system substrate-binding protein